MTEPRNARLDLGAGTGEIFLQEGSAPALFPVGRRFQIEYENVDQRHVHVHEDLLREVAAEQYVVGASLTFRTDVGPDAAAIVHWRSSVTHAVAAFHADGAASPVWQDAKRTSADARSVMSSETRPRFEADCPTRPILDQVADKWSMMVLQEPTQFNEIRRQLEGVTQRVLTQTLRRLERNGMITRRVLETSPVGVEYSRTPLGVSFCAPFTRLYEWTHEHSDEIVAHQRVFDGRIGSL